MRVVSVIRTSWLTSPPGLGAGRLTCALLPDPGMLQGPHPVISLVKGLSGEPRIPAQNLY